MKCFLNVTLRLGYRTLALVALCMLAMPPATAYAQGVTTGEMNGIVKDANNQPVVGATVLAVHAPSGTTYEATTRPDGRFFIPGMRVGGPYTVTVAYGGAGASFDPQVQEDIYINLGLATDLDFIVQAITVEVTVTAESSTIFASSRTGAATALTRQELFALPTITGRLESITRLTPQATVSADGRISFAGQDNRLNNITVDGSYFNNSFGLGGTPGERTGVAPISLSAIEQVQISVAPYDVRQGNFVGAGINTVTRSGTNEFRGSLYREWRDNDLVGTKAKGLDFNPGVFNFGNTGLWVSGPVVKNKMFFFGNFEDEQLDQPGTTFRANAGGEPVGGSITRVLASDLQLVSGLLQNRFGYDTGPFQDYAHETPARRYLVKGDYNFNDRNKLTVRYNHLDSITDVLVSNSSSLGFGSRRTNTTALNFQNSNYQIKEDIRSIVGEWNSVIGDNRTNNFIAGYTYQDESRASRGTFFPFVDILDPTTNTTYMSFGFEPFTPNNELRYKTLQLQDYFTLYRSRHSFTFGASTERYESENIFFPGSQSVYTYNSLADFQADVAGTPVTLRRFQVRWNNIPGQDKPIQPLEVWYSGAYAQDDWRVSDRMKLTLGVRMDVPLFAETGYQNAQADALTFRDEDGNPAQYATEKLPSANILWSPRAGFNWDLAGNRNTQLRGGTGIFTGRPAYVWISNQIGNTGVLTGFQELNNTMARPFNPDPNHYKPTNVTGEPASSYELALTDQDFKFPQLWRNNIAVDQKLPWGWSGTAEFMYSRDVNGVYYINANLPAAQSSFVGADARPRWTSNRIHSFVQNAVVLKNQNVGTSWNLALSADRAMRNGLGIKAAYSYGEAKNTVDPGSIAFGSWNNNQHPGDPNNPGKGFGAASPGHRVFTAVTYTRDWFRFGGTTVSMFWEARNNGNTSYTFSGDLNGDGGTSNDLLYIHRDVSEMNFQTFTSGGRTFTAAEQAAAWNAYIEQDSYLSKRRGQYAERGAVFLPFVRRVDLSVAQDVFANIAGKRNSLQFRLDMVNFGNLLNSDWGVGKRLINNQPLVVPTSAQGGPVDAQGRAQYRLRVVNNELLTKSLETTTFFDDVWRLRLSLRYTFN